MVILGLICAAWLATVGAIWYFYNWKITVVSFVLTLLALMYPKVPNKVIMMAVILVALATVWYWYGFMVILLAALWLSLSLLYKRIDEGLNARATHRI